LQSRGRVSADVLTHLQFASEGRIASLTHKKIKKQPRIYTDHTDKIRSEIQSHHDLKSAA